MWTGLDKQVRDHQGPDLPPQAGRYRLEVEATRGAPLPDLTVRSVWTFTSGYAPTA
jgi:hypothetical protein